MITKTARSSAAGASFRAMNQRMYSRCSAESSSRSSPRIASRSGVAIRTGPPGRRTRAHSWSMWSSERVRRCARSCAREKTRSKEASGSGKRLGGVEIGDPERRPARTSVFSQPGMLCGPGTEMELARGVVAQVAAQSIHGRSPSATPRAQLVACASHRERLRRRPRMRLDTASSARRSSGVSRCPAVRARRRAPHGARASREREALDRALRARRRRSARGRRARRRRPRRALRRRAARRARSRRGAARRRPPRRRPARRCRRSPRTRREHRRPSPRSPSSGRGR